MRLRTAACFAAMMLAALTAASQSRDFDDEFDDQKKSWQEIQAQIPAYPNTGNLVRVQTGSASGHRFYVDTTSITLGVDGVVRYVAVINTSGGATNVLFEGMRCETREQKLYAVGHKDGTWARARDPKWERVVLRDLTPYRHTLYHEFFCPSGSRPAPASQIVSKLKSGYGHNRSSSAHD